MKCVDFWTDPKIVQDMGVLHDLLMKRWASALQETDSFVSSQRDSVSNMDSKCVAQECLILPKWDSN